MELKDPKRKRTYTGQIATAKASQQPLPVLIESVSGIVACDYLWPVYVGTFNGDSVVISNQDEMSSLFNMGFFGKGCLSRGYPNFGKTKHGIPPLLRERQWKRRKLWIEQLLPFTETSYIQQSKQKEDEHNRKAINSKKDKTVDSSASKVSTPVDSDVIEIMDAEMEEETDRRQETPKGVGNKAKSNSVREECITLIEEESSKGTTIQEINIIEDSDCSVENLPGGSATKEVNPNSEKKTGKSVGKGSADRLTGTSGNSNGQESDSQSGLIPVPVPDKVLVINDENYDDESCKHEPRICDEIIKTVVETLNLSLEEAFFLSFGLGCLQVMNLQGIFLTIGGMWRTYRESKQNFVTTYVAYHYFRSKGWIVKPGTKFGGDFLLYKQGPPFYHASYIVLVEEVNDIANSRIEYERPVSWTKIIAMNRMAETAAKEILLCQVQWPSNLTREELDDPRVVSKYKVQEVLFRRWVSTSRKDEKENL